MADNLVPFFRLEISKFLWWPASDETEKTVKAVDCRMFVGPWPKISKKAVYGLEHGNVEFREDFKVTYSRSATATGVYFVTGIAVFFTTKDDLIAAGYDFNPNTWQPFVVKLKTDAEVKAAAVKALGLTNV